MQLFLAAPTVKGLLNISQGDMMGFQPIHSVGERGMGQSVSGNRASCIKAKRHSGRRRRFNALRLTTALVGVSFLGMVCPTVATSADWIGGSDYWDSPGNWSPVGVPDSTTTVNVTNGTATVPFGVTAYSSNAIIDLGGEVDFDMGSWEIDGNSPGLNQRGGALIVGDVGNGLLSINNSGLVETTGSLAGTILIGNQAGSNGTIDVGGDSSGRLVNAGPVGHPGNFYVGYDGVGALNVNWGGYVTGFYDMQLGINPTGSGSLFVSRGFVDLGTAVLTVGNKGHGVLTVENAGTVATVRRQGFWDNRRRELTEALVHQVCHIRPLHLDEASGAV